MCYFKNWLFFVLLVWPCFAPELGLRSQRAIRLFFDLSPSIIQYWATSHRATSRQHQSNTKTDPQSEPQHDRARAIITYRCYMNKTVNRLYIFYTIFPTVWPKIFKKVWARYFWKTQKRYKPPPLLCWNTETVIQITQNMCYLWK